MKTKNLALRSSRSRPISISCLSVVLLIGGSLYAQTETPAPATPAPEVPAAPEVTPEPVVTPEVPDTSAIDGADATQAAARLSTRFESLAGSEDNASALVTGLRTGSEITFTTEVEGRPVTSTLQPATSELGYGNVYLALGLAEQELAKAGITEPTAAQLEAALNGGVITVGAGETLQDVTMAGVLTLRAEGQGWGQIARQLDVRLGDVVSNLHRDARSLDRPMARPVREDRPRPAIERTDRPLRPERVDRPARPERAALPERPMVPVRPERPMLPERPVRPERPTRP